MLNKSKREILKHNLRTNLAIKFMYKNLILKSIIHNQQINYKYKIIANYLIKKKNSKYQKKTCFISGLHKGVDTKLNLSRHNLNYFSKLGIMQNFKIKSW